MINKYIFLKSFRVSDNVENIVQPGRPQMAILHMRIASRIPKATNTHTKTHRLCNARCFSTATAAVRKCFMFSYTLPVLPYVADTTDENYQIRKSSLIRSVHTGSISQPLTYSSTIGGKAAGVWSWPLTSSVEVTYECRLPSVRFLGLHNKLPLHFRQMVDVRTDSFLIPSDLSLTTYDVSYQWTLCNVS